MTERWITPDFQEIGLGGECTAYAGTQGAYENKPTDYERNEPESSATVDVTSRTPPAR